MPGEVGRLVIDGAAFAEFAHRLRADLEHDLAAFDIRDPAALKDRWFTLALLDAIEGRWNEALVSAAFSPDATRGLDRSSRVDLAKSLAPAARPPGRSGRDVS